MPGEIAKYLYTDEEMRPIYSRVAKSFNYAEVNQNKSIRKNGIILHYTLCSNDNLNIYCKKFFITCLKSMTLKNVVNTLYSFKLLL